VVTDLTDRDFLARCSGVLRALGLGSFAKRIRDRNLKEIPDQKVVSFPLYGIVRVARRLIISDPGRLRRHHALANEWFGKLVARLDLSQYDGVYVFNGAGLEIARIAKGKGLKVIVDQTSAPIEAEEKLLAEERRRWKGWEAEPKDPQGWQVLARREELEWELADLIVCGSEYVKHCLVEKGVDSAKIRVVHPGAPEWSLPEKSQRPEERFRDGNPLRVLFAGTLCLRKGIPYVVEAARALRGAAEFRAVGSNGLTRFGLQQVRAWVEYCGFVPRSEMAAQYRWADVFLLPSLSEGSANVCFEALAAGLPVITTPNAGSVVRDGVEGFIVPIRCCGSIVNAVQVLMDDPALLERVQQSVTEAVKDYTWAKYEHRLVQEIRDLFS
jgi:glycosyltransferase involved in cell wall biosynthesis